MSPLLPPTPPPPPTVCVCVCVQPDFQSDGIAITLWNLIHDVLVHTESFACPLQPKEVTILYLFAFWLCQPDRQSRIFVMLIFSTDTHL